MMGKFARCVKKTIKLYNHWELNIGFSLMFLLLPIKGMSDSTQGYILCFGWLYGFIFTPMISILKEDALKCDRYGQFLIFHVIHINLYLLLIIAPAHVCEIGKWWNLVFAADGVVKFMAAMCCLFLCRSQNKKN